MFCALSGQVPDQPVVSTKSGHVFEKRLVQKYIKESNGKCPITGEDLTDDDLLQLKISQVAKPRAPNASSIPSMLVQFQNEWDSLMLESFQLKQQYAQLRQELSNALYQNDAAKRVIARLLKERDEARNALATFKADAANYVPQNTDMDVDESQKTGLPDHVVADLDAKGNELTQYRKKRKAPASTLLSNLLATYSNLASFSLSSKPTSIDIKGHQVLVGMSNGMAAIVATKGDVLITFKAHTRKTTSVLFASEDTLFTTGNDGVIKCWNWNGEEVTPVWEETVHEGEVSGVVLHPCGKYIVSCGNDKQFALVDAKSGDVIVRAGNSDESAKSYTSVSIHPDGFILAVGTSNGIVRIYDLKTLTNAASFEGHSGAISSIHFSENGYTVCVSTKDSNDVKIWDLRKLKEVGNVSVGDGKGSKAEFDFSALYLGAVSGNTLRVFANKTWEQLAEVSLFDKGSCGGFKWGEDAKFVVALGEKGGVVVGV